ncbi:FadR/GntR family transcriptional regulator [Brochothrix campestris]|uniref:GntR family transcriptional regulator n=1 Tax=Brochothrix campestris FSL F6-1037 TaxID=1265861 RepID=W7CNL5_9LIST|nr:FCD domain-containing protein [Brochothrix campestris]EUJ41129.1 GntR family transcriptional regulator [Brochothrix campestris FSL F6-1037]
MRKAALTDSVKNYIENGILTEKFPLGSLLPAELLFAQTLGVSAHPVRKAIEHLIKNGVLQKQTNGRKMIVGFKVIPLRGDNDITECFSSNSLLMHSFLVRRTLETETARIAALKATAADIQQLRLYLNNLLVELNSPTRLNDDYYLEAAFYFHRSLAQATHYTPLIEAIEQLRATIELQQFLMLKYRTIVADDGSAQTALFDAITAGDSALASQLM